MTRVPRAGWTAPCGYRCESAKTTLTIAAAMHVVMTTNQISISSRSHLFRSHAPRNAREGRGLVPSGDAVGSRCGPQADGRS
jgi:hypothetical protein